MYVCMCLNDFGGNCISMSRIKMILSGTIIKYSFPLGVNFTYVIDI